jgi:ectoine hydroxylase-related dioxygenase (phytanoyl-CoA dioxygenase family)
MAQDVAPISPPDGNGLLSVDQMARFVVDGYLEFGDLIPEELNRAVYEDQSQCVVGTELKEDHQWHVTDNNNSFYEYSAAVREVHNLPQVRAVIRSLVGPGSNINHSSLHATPPHQKRSQSWHVDDGYPTFYEIVSRPPHSFDVLTAYFTHHVTHEMGPTLILPGSHMRNVSGKQLARYKNLEGQKSLAGPGGRIIFMHANLWHCGQGNLTDDFRFMFKIRFTPRVAQQRQFNYDDWDSDHIRNYFLRNNHTHILTGEALEVVADREAWWEFLCAS